MILWLKINKRLQFSSETAVLLLCALFSCFSPATVMKTTSVCTVHVCEQLSVLLQSFSQQVVEAGNHRSGIVVQACCDHGVVIDLQNIDKEKLMWKTSQLANHFKKTTILKQVHYRLPVQKDWETLPIFNHTVIFNFTNCGKLLMI